MKAYFKKWIGSTFAEWASFLLIANKKNMTERDQLIKDEGLMLYPYYCPSRKLTIGVGRNLDDNPLTADEAMHLLASRPHIPLSNTSFDKVRALLLDDFEENGITKDEAYYLLDNDIRKVQEGLKSGLSWFASAPVEVQNILTNMGFQMGVPGLLKFRNTLPLIEKGKYKEAAEHMKKSLISIPVWCG